jgi:hypothetical protein
MEAVAGQMRLTVLGLVSPTGRLHGTISSAFGRLPSQTRVIVCRRLPLHLVLPPPLELPLPLSLPLALGLVLNPPPH